MNEKVYETKEELDRIFQVNNPKYENKLTQEDLAYLLRNMYIYMVSYLGRIDKTLTDILEDNLNINSDIKRLNTKCFS